MLKHLKFGWVVFVVIAVLMSMGIWAAVAQPDVNDVIYGAIQKNNGLLRIIDGANPVYEYIDHWVDGGNAFIEPASALTSLYINANNYDVDFQVAGTSDLHVIHVDASADSLGVGVSAPNEKLECSAKIRANTGFNFNGTDGSTDTAAGTISDIDVQGGIVTSITKVTGLTGTYNFDATTSGNITSMTFNNGILTGVTTLP